MKHIREYAVIVAVIVGVGLYLLLGSSGGIHYDLPQLPSISVQEADTIAIHGGRSLTLRQSNGTWRIKDQGYEADGEKVREMLRKAAEPKITALVSEAGDDARYHLEGERRIEVRVLRDGATVRELYLGKSSGEVNNTYIRLPGDQNVYMAETDLRGAFEVTASELRDKTVFRIDSGNVASLRVASENATRRFRRVDPSGEGGKAKREHAWETANGQTVRTGPLEDLLRSLQDVNCREYRKDLSRKGTRYTIAVETDTLHRLTLFASQGESSGTYEAASSQRPDPFALPGYLGEDLVSSAKELLKEPRASSGPE